MKYIRSILIFLLIFSCFSAKVKAANTETVQAITKGNIEAGQSVQILINIDDIKSLYAAEVQYKYDPSLLKIKSIEAGELINKPNINKFEAINKIDEQNGIVKYGFTCLGDIAGFSGTGTFVKINAEVIKKVDLSLNSKPKLSEFTKDYNLKLQLCDSNIKELDYSFTTKNESTPIDSKDSNPNSTGNTSTNNANTVNSGNNQAGTTNLGSTQETPNINGQQTPTTNNEQINTSSESNVQPKVEQPVVKTPDQQIGSKDLKKQEAEKKQKSSIYIVLGIVAAVILFTVGYLIKKRRKSNKDSLNL